MGYHIFLSYYLQFYTNQIKYLHSTTYIFLLHSTINLTFSKVLQIGKKYLTLYLDMALSLIFVFLASELICIKMAINK